MLPVAVRATLVAEQIARQYENAVVVLPGLLDATHMAWLMHAQHVVLFGPATTAGYERLRQAQRDLARYTTSGRTGVSVVKAGLPGESTGRPEEIVADFVVPLQEWAAPEKADAASPLPEGVEQVVTTLIERINHTHQVAVYVPTTAAVDRATDTTAYVERTLAFLGTRFGGATSTTAQGVWHSDTVGLVGEAVHVVQTYATGQDLHRYLPEVLAYVKAIKAELEQEAMALEVDHQLMLL
jgi:hypothetical protein